MKDQHPLHLARLYFAVVWWLFWNREAHLSLFWLLRYHRRPHAWAKQLEKETHR